MTDMRNIVILTGAGISAESGIDTFRDGGGLWEQHRVEDVATPEAFVRDPDLVLRFYDQRREAIQAKQPNAAHEAIARLDAEWDGELLVVTQNVDDLHERAGARRVLHMHGTHLNAWCTACDIRSRWTGPMIDRPPCPACGTPALRPDVVWFGEMPYEMERIHAAFHIMSMPRVAAYLAQDDYKERTRAQVCSHSQPALERGNRKKNESCKMLLLRRKKRH